jgi:tetratricopeptide (TPR) repeat protein
MKFNNTYNNCQQILLTISKILLLFLNMEESKNKLECCIHNEFLDSLNVFNKAALMYRKKHFKEALSLLEESLQEINVPTAAILSRYYDFAASILWKIGQQDKSFYLWEKSLQYDHKNRHSQLSISMLFDKPDTTDDVCELFIKIKLNEFFCMRGEGYKTCHNSIGEEKIINYLLQFWEKNLSSMNFDETDELEIVDYFINLKVFGKGKP